MSTPHVGHGQCSFQVKIVDTYTVVGFVKKISGYGLEVPTTESAYLNSDQPAIVRLTTGVVSYQPVEITVDLVIADAAQAYLIASAGTPVEENFKYVVAGTTYSFKGFVRSFKFGDATVEGPQEATISIDLSSVPT